jgi:hypothetical protein
LLADLLCLGDELTRMAGHPEVVPCEHANCGRKDGGIQYFLAGSLECVGNGGGEEGDDNRAAHTDRDAPGDPLRAAPDTDRSRHDDADDQRGFEHLTEDDDCDGKHGSSAGDEMAAYGRMVISPRPERADIDRDLLTCRDHLLTPQLGAFEFRGGGPLYLLARGNLQLIGLEPIIVNRD